MSVTDLVDELCGAARSAVLRAKAVKPCPAHKHILVRVGDPDAERRAYALATATLKREGRMFLREDLMPAIKDELDMAADGECPECACLMDASEVMS